MDAPENKNPKRIGEPANSPISPVLRGSLISLARPPGRGKGVSPLAALIPRVGTTESLIGLQDKIILRLDALTSSDEATGEKSPEESMLRQVLQWLTQGEEE